MVSSWHRRVLYGATALVVTSGIVFFILMMVQCSPISFWWRHIEGDTDGKCTIVNTIGIMLYVFSVTSALFDMTVGLLPIILVRGLQMSRKTKIAAAGLLGLACMYISSFSTYWYPSPCHSLADSIYSASVAIIIRIPFVTIIHDKGFLCMPFHLIYFAIDL